MDIIIVGMVAGIMILIILLLPKKFCPNCGESIPKFRLPTNMREALFGGWTCKKCGYRLDRCGNVIVNKKD